jgi:hypothetical protein
MHRTSPAIIATLAAGLVAAGCASSTTQTSTTPPGGSSAATGSTPASSESQTITVTASPTASLPASAPSQTESGGTAAPGVARTAPAPAYVQQGSPTGELGRAVATVQANGYTPDDTAEYHAGQTLRVLVGTSTGNRYEQRVFFFLGSKYLGTDTKQPSAGVSVVSQGATEATLAYSLYRPSDQLCCPGGGHAEVTFQLNNGKLTNVEPIPPASTRR